MQNGDKVIVRGTVNQVHEDGSVWITLPTGQSLYTDQRNCEFVEVISKAELQSNESDDLDSKKAKDLLEICAAEGVTYSMNAPKAALVVAIRAKRGG